MKENIAVFVVLFPYYIGWVAIGYGVCKLSGWIFDKIVDRIYKYKKAKKNHG